MNRGPSNRNERSLADRQTFLGETTKNSEVQPPLDRGRLVEHEVIGQGGMGIVWRARDVRLNRLVAVKRVLPGLANYDAIVGRFLEEAKALAQLKHPSIVQIYSLGQDEYGDFIEMEFVEGPTLLDLIKERSTFSVDEAVRVIRKVCEGLHVVHKQGIIHRDIKPSNILIDSTGQPKLTDFGLAQSSSVGLHTLSGQTLGTEGYMAPEQIEDAKNVTRASDQYSLAATLYHMVTGSSPRKIDLRKVPEKLLDLVSKGLEDTPKDRFASIADFHRALGLVKRYANTNTIPSSQPIAAKDFAVSQHVAQANADRCHAVARQAFESFDDKTVIEVLQRIPENLRDRELEQLATKRRQRAAELERDIEQCVRQFKTDGLRGLVDEFLSLYPGRSDMLTLREQLPKDAPKLLDAPFAASQAKRAQEAWAEYLGRPVSWKNVIGMKFRLIPPGEFQMGAPNGERNASENEMPQHKVQITKPFYMGIFPVTQNEYRIITENNPSHFNGELSLPIEQVSWHDAQAFLKQLSAKDSGEQYRLPTEAEWEYACRAGSTTPYWFGSELNGRQANCDGKSPYGTSSQGASRKQTTPVGQYSANPFGIYDQHGQVWEWCKDWYAEDYYMEFSKRIAIDPSGPLSGSSRCLRGGSWGNMAGHCRSAHRHFRVPTDSYRSIGFRVVCNVL